MAENLPNKLNTSQPKKAVHLKNEHVVKKLNFDSIKSPMKKPSVIKEESTPDLNKMKSTTE